MSDLSATPDAPHPTSIVITMAGFGRRFQDAGHTIPKYRIKAHGKSLFAWSLRSLSNFIGTGCPVVFVARRDDAARPFLATETAALGITDWTLIELDAPTDGQATSAMLAAQAVEEEAPFLVYNIDTYVEPHALPAIAVHGDGWLPCFPGEGEGWSFARVDDITDQVVEVREKKRISPHATIGLYWFKSFTLYRDLYRRYYEDGNRLEAGERYIAPLYNQLIADGGAVYIHEVPATAVHPLGIPAEVEAFTHAPPPA